MATVQPKPGQSPVAAGFFNGSSVQASTNNIAVNQGTNPQQMARIDDRLEQQGAALQNIAEPCQGGPAQLEGGRCKSQTARCERRTARCESRTARCESRTALDGPPPQVRALEERRQWLKSQYQYCFVGAAEGELIVVPVKPEPGDLIKVDKVPDGHPYKDMIGIWNGPGRNAEGFIGKKNREFSMRQVSVVVAK
jgi:hypothetical protein